MMTPDSKFRPLWRYVEDHFLCGPDSYHGIEHWKRVDRNGRVLAARTGADMVLVELFALFHDSCRWTEGTDPGHGARGAALAAQLRGDIFDLSDTDFDILHFACTWHQDRDFSDDVTIATCWDADRLDIGRVGIIPDPDLLNTDVAKQLAGGSNLLATLSNLAVEQDKSLQTDL